EESGQRAEHGELFPEAGLARERDAGLGAAVVEEAQGAAPFDDRDCGVAALFEELERLAVSLAGAFDERGARVVPGVEQVGDVEARLASDEHGAEREGGGDREDLRDEAGRDAAERDGAREQMQERDDEDRRLDAEEGHEQEARRERADETS